jgi:hypothetical protein
MVHSADIWPDIVEVIGDEHDQDNVVDPFPTEGRTVEQIREELTRRYGAVAPQYITDCRT